MKLLLLGMALLLAAGVTGCTFHTQPANVNTRVGTDHMPKARGLFDRDSPYATNDGLVVYSSNPNQPSLVGPGRAQPAPSATTAPRLPATTLATPPAASGAAPLSPQDYQQFRNFQAYQRFLALPTDSPQRLEFQQWLEWQYYRQWKARNAQ
jgi:hypothetical protein